MAFLRPDEDVPHAVAWLGALGPRAILLTDGAGPVRVVVGGRMHAVPVPPVDVVDTVGAGDTFGGAAVAWLVRRGISRATLDADAAISAARFGARAAAIACTRPGADPPTLAELGGGRPQTDRTVVLNILKFQY